MAAEPALSSLTMSDSLMPLLLRLTTVMLAARPQGRSGRRVWRPPPHRPAPAAMATRPRPNPPAIPVWRAPRTSRWRQRLPAHPRGLHTPAAPLTAQRAEDRPAP